MAFIIKEGTTGGDGTDDAIIKSIRDYLSAQGLRIRNKEEDDNHTQKQIDDAFGNRNRQLEDLVLEVTGLRKNTDEKWYDYYKRATGDRLKEITALQVKVKEYEKTGGPDANKQIEELNAQIATLKESHTQELTKLNTTIQGMESSSFEREMEQEIDSYVADIRGVLRSDQDPKILEDAIKYRKEQFRRENKGERDAINGVIYKDKDGKIIRSHQDGKPKKTKEILPSYFEDLQDKNKKQPGAGSGGAGGGAAGDPAWKSFSFPEAKTQVEIHTALLSKGLNPETKEFNEAFNHHIIKDGKPLPMRSR